MAMNEEYPATHELALMDARGEIDRTWKERCPTLHFCNEWDGMLVHDRMPEFEVCICFRRSHEEEIDK